MTCAEVRMATQYLARRCYRWSINRSNYLNTISIPSRHIAETLILLGSITLLVGVIFINPIHVINNSIIGHNGYGMIIELANPEEILSFIRTNNKNILGIVLLLCGYFLSVRSDSQYYKITLSRIILLCIWLYVFSVLIAGFTRNIVIENWKSTKCEYRYLITYLLVRSHCQDMHYDDLAHTEMLACMHTTMKHLHFVISSLNIYTDITIEDSLTSNLEDNNIEALQTVIKNDIANTSLFYYLSCPIKLFRDIFL